MHKELVIAVSDLKWLQVDCNNCKSKALVDGENVSPRLQCCLVPPYAFSG